MTYTDLLQELEKHSNVQRADSMRWFFKTGPGEYGEGDNFRGLTMPQIRAVARGFRKLPLNDLGKTLESEFHEDRMAALVIMADMFSRSEIETQKEYYELYRKGLKENRINNWDLVDVSAPHVVGDYAYYNSPDCLYELADSPILWEKRTAIVSTFAFLKHGIGEHTIRIAEIQLHETHDLMHKAVGWLLREMGKRVDHTLLTDFLDKYHKEMPRTMLRYSIERLTPAQKAHYMKRD